MLNRTLCVDVIKLLVIVFIVFIPQFFCWLFNSSSIVYSTNPILCDVILPLRWLITLTLVLLINSSVIYLWVRRYGRVFSA